jgi:hypothetical protein
MRHSQGMTSHCSVEEVKISWSCALVPHFGLVPLVPYYTVDLPLQGQLCILKRFSPNGIFHTIDLNFKSVSIILV